MTKGSTHYNQAEQKGGFKTTKKGRLRLVAGCNVEYSKKRTRHRGSGSLSIWLRGGSPSLAELPACPRIDARAPAGSSLLVASGKSGSMNPRCSDWGHASNQNQVFMVTQSQRILHHSESMGIQCLLVFTGESSFQGC